ncbi:hypothetical protein [Thioclava sp.]|uniref:hypothetical protein n=1 Tax=Thioclava sp. TaxID=1933450 RepID=UPI003AA80FC0
MAKIALTKISSKAIPTPAIALIGFQRTSQISRKSRVAWEAGDRSVLIAEAEARRDDIFKGALSEVHDEFMPTRAALTKAKRKPQHVIDIGCGQALNDVLMVKAYDSRITLIDIEETSDQYHLWRDSGSGYASLAAAKAFLEDNGARDVQTLNPRLDPNGLADVSGDLVTSLISCGFHYPIGEYLDLMLSTAKSGGAVILDLRLHYRDAPDDALRTLYAETKQAVISDAPKRQRVMFSQ